MDFLSFGNTMRKDIGQNISKNLNGKYTQKLLDHAKQSTADSLKTASKKKQFKKQQKRMVIWLVIKFADKIIKVSKISPQNTLENVEQWWKKIWNLIHKYLKKDVYIQKEKRILLIDLIISIII